MTAEKTLAYAILHGENVQDLIIHEVDALGVFGQLIKDYTYQDTSATPWNRWQKISKGCAQARLNKHIKACKCR